MFLHGEPFLRLHVINFDKWLQNGSMIRDDTRVRQSLDIKNPLSFDT